MENLTKVYFIYYVYEFKDGHDYVKLLGAFSSREKAKEALLNIKKNPALKKHKKFFIIDVDKINFLGWTEGYITVN